MAVVKIDPRSRRWLITPADIMERSALLKLPTKKWMNEMGCAIVPWLPGNARELRAQIQAGHLSGFDAEAEASIEEILQPARQERTFPTWYKFNNAKFAPAEHQIDALKRLFPVDAGALLMEMGTMKTRVMIDLASAHFFERRIQFVIVIVPLTVKMTTWVDELANFSPCPYNFIDVDSDFQPENFRVHQDRLNWLVVGTESLSAGQTYRRLEPVTRLGIPYAVIVDESTRVSNHEAICTQASFNLRRNAKIRMIATGFEVKKNIEDLYSQFEFLDPNIIGVGDYVAFRNRYCMMGGYKKKQIIGYDNIDELMGLIAPHVFQCTKEILKLPPKLYERREIILAPEQKKVYAAMKRGEIEGASVKSVLTRMLRLQQIATGYYNLDKTETVDPVTRKIIKTPVEFVEVIKPSSNPKLRELLLIAREIQRPMLVWVQSMYEYRIVTEALGKLGRVLSIIGDTPKEQRNGIVKQFQTGDIPYFVGTEAAGGIGTTLTAAGTVAYFSNSQRLENRVQSEDRAHRRGQTGSVTVIDLVAKGTVDVLTLANHAEKIELAMYVKAALRKRITLDSILSGEIDVDIMHELAAERDALLATEGLSEDEITQRRIARAYGIPA